MQKGKRIERKRSEKSKISRRDEEGKWKERGERGGIEENREKGKAERKREGRKEIMPGGLDRRPPPSLALIYAYFRVPDDRSRPIIVDVMYG